MRHRQNDVNCGITLANSFESDALRCPVFFLRPFYDKGVRNVTLRKKILKEILAGVLSCPDRASLSNRLNALKSK